MKNRMCWSGSPGTPGMDFVQEAEKRTGKMYNAQSQRMDRIEFDALSSKMKELEAEVESLKNKTLCLLVSFVVILIFASFSVMNIIRQYSTIHDYYMDSQRIDREIGQSLNELIQKIEELQSKSE